MFLFLPLRFSFRVNMPEVHPALSALYSAADQHQGRDVVSVDVGEEKRWEWRLEKKVENSYQHNHRLWCLVVDFFAALVCVYLEKGHWTTACRSACCNDSTKPPGGSVATDKAALTP